MRSSSLLRGSATFTKADEAGVSKFSQSATVTSAILCISSFTISSSSSRFESHLVRLFGEIGDSWSALLNSEVSLTLSAGSVSVDEIVDGSGTSCHSWAVTTDLGKIGITTELNSSSLDTSTTLLFSSIMFTMNGTTGHRIPFKFG